MKQLSRRWILRREQVRTALLIILADVAIFAAIACIIISSNQPDPYDDFKNEVEKDYNIQLISFNPNDYNKYQKEHYFGPTIIYEANTGNKYDVYLFSESNTTKLYTKTTDGTYKEYKYNPGSVEERVRNSTNAPKA